MFKYLLQVSEKAMYGFGFGMGMSMAFRLFPDDKRECENSQSKLGDCK
jgi:hypothetical protein